MDRFGTLIAEGNGRLALSAASAALPELREAALPGAIPPVHYRHDVALSEDRLLT